MTNCSCPSEGEEPVLRDARCFFDTEHTEDNMPILLWLLGVPLGLVIVLMLVGVV
jgi:hypothetical protein